MEHELAALEDKLAHLVELVKRLRAENSLLRQQLVNSQNDNHALTERIEVAMNRLAALVDRIPREPGEHR